LFTYMTALAQACPEVVIVMLEISNAEIGVQVMASLKLSNVEADLWH